MEESLDAKRVKERSPTFPFISLERALDRARQFYVEEKRGVSPFTRAVRHWNYSEASSGALQTVAALRSYGLMEDAGKSGASRQLKLSQLALSILLDQRPESEERLRCVREAALMPAVAAEIYSKWPDGLPSDSTVNHFLVLERRFNEETAVKALRILKENQQFALIEEGVHQSSDPLVIEDNAADSRLERLTSAVSDSNRAVRPASFAFSTAPVVLAPLQIRHKGVLITLTFSEEPTKEVFGYLAKWAEFEQNNVEPKSTLANSRKDEA